MYKVRTTEEIGVECVKCGAVTAGMHMCYERPGPVTALNAAAVIGYDKWSRDRGGGGAAPGADASWAGRDRERDRERERERQARAHQMSHVHAAEPDASSLFPAPIRVNGNRDRLSQQLHNKLGDYQLAQALLDDPSKSIGICAEPQSPAPCPPSRRESEFKKPAHAPQNGRVHHRQHMYSKIPPRGANVRPLSDQCQGPQRKNLVNHASLPALGVTPDKRRARSGAEVKTSLKNEATGPTSAPAHRPPNLKINGFQTQIDSSQPPIESILKEMKSLPIPLSGMAATPRKEQEDKFVFNHALNRLVQDNSQSNDLKTPIAKPGFDSRISNSRISLSPDVNKDLGLSESEDEIGGPTTRLEPLRSPIGSGSPSSGSESSDTETETSSGESVTPDAATAQGGGAPAPRSSWSLSNFAPPAAQPAGQPQPYDALAKELRHALADVKGKATSPISDMSDSESSSASPAARRRRAPALSSDDDNHASPRRPSSQPPAAKRGRPPSKAAAKPSEPPKKRGRPRKQRPAPPAPAPPPAAPPAPDSEPETEPAPAHPQALIDTKTQIFRRVFTPKKGDEGGGKGGKGGKGKGGKGKGQVTIIEVTAPETNVDDDSRRRRESAERRSEEAMSRLSPPHQPLPVRLATDRSPRDRSPRDRATERTSNDRISSERTERISDRVPDRIPSDRGPDRISDRVPDRTTSDRISDRIPSERLTNDRTPSDRLVDRIPSDRPRIPSERMTDRMPSERMSNDRTPSERTGNDRIPERPSTDRLPTNDRVSAKMSTSDRLTVDRVKPERHTDRLSMDRLPGDRAPSPRDKAGDRFVRAEADVGPATEASSNVSSRRRRAAPDRRPRLMVRLPLARLSAAARRALRDPAPAPAPRRLPALPLLPALPHLPHLPLMPQQIASAAPLAPRGTSGSSGSSGSGGAGQTPIYYSYFERLPADALSDEERDHKFYLCEATRLRSAAEREQEPLNRVMLYLESVLCFVLTGRVLELELDTKRAFTIYRETIEYIKSIHSMPQRFRASPHSTFSKLDILSLRVQALLYLRMFKMYNREVKEYYKIVQDYQQKVNVPACAESVSPLSPTPSPAGSVGSVGSGSAGSGASASSGYCSLAHAVPAHAHHALLQLNKYYTFLYVAFELWEQADCLCRLRPNQDLFIAVDRKCGPLTLFSTFRHLVQYVRHAISLLKNAPRE